MTQAASSHFKAFILQAGGLPAENFHPYAIVGARLILKRPLPCKREKKSADLTLVRDSRTFPLAKGMNRIQFSWANTHIDPTSLSLEFKDPSLPATITQMAFPPNSRELGIWHIDAREACRADLDITYFTSGISWQSFYMAFELIYKMRNLFTGPFERYNRLPGKS